MDKEKRHLRQMSLGEEFRSALYLYFPFVLKQSGASGSSIMNGALPGTKEWIRLYGEHKNIEFEWQKFRQRHNAAQERAELVRNFLGNEALEVEQDDGLHLVSLLRPDIRFSGCVGRSMDGSNIRFMDMVASYPRNGDVVAEPRGEPDAKRSRNGELVYNDFRIHIGHGVTLAPGSVAEMEYLDDVKKEALDSCPPELKEWAADLRKVRHIGSVKVFEDGTQMVGVYTNRDFKKEGIDHPLDNVQGRVITCYGRENYEQRIKNTGDWNRLSFSAQQVDLLRPEYDWDEEFAGLQQDERYTLEAALLGDETAAKKAVHLLRQINGDRPVEFGVAQQIS